MRRTIYLSAADYFPALLRFLRAERECAVECYARVLPGGHRRLRVCPHPDVYFKDRDWSFRVDFGPVDEGVEIALDQDEPGVFPEPDDLEEVCHATQ